MPHRASSSWWPSRNGTWLPFGSASDRIAIQAVAPSLFESDYHVPAFSMPAPITRLHHETYLSALESSSRSHAWIPDAHEDARRSRRDQCAARQRPQAPVVGLIRRALRQRSVTPMFGRMRRPADFERALASQPRARSAHFAAHHAARLANCASADHPGDLSTGHPKACAQPVDEAHLAAPEQCWLGTVLPKRHARRAATRNLLRRQIRAAMERHHAALAHGLWIVRLRAPFDARRYTSAASDALRAAARDELDALLTRAAT